MRRQTLGRTTLLSFLWLKPITARKSPEWTLYSSSNDSTTALVESSFPAALGSAASSTETLVAAPSTSPHSISTTPLVSQSDMPLVTASDSSFTVALPKPSEEPITLSALDQQSTMTTTTSSSTSTPSSGGAVKPVPSAAAGSSRRKRASPKKKSGKRGGSSVPRSMEDEATMAYVRMGMMGALGATAGLVMI